VAVIPNRDDICRLRDGRALAFAEWGVLEGRPVLAFHGAPGSRLWCPDDFDPGKTTTECGVRLITVDRPGYGRSDPLPGRTLLGWADDVEQLLDALSIDRCPVVGVSAGAPHAMACAVRLPQRLTRLGSVGGEGPIYQVPGLWEQLDADWRAELELGAQDRFAALDEARRRSRWLADDPESMLDPANWPEVDRWPG
jgi:pimeloyl-ACP methyl ester carboxylesterase